LGLALTVEREHLRAKSGPWAKRHFKASSILLENNKKVGGVGMKVDGEEWGKKGNAFIRRERTYYN